MWRPPLPRRKLAYGGGRFYCSFLSDESVPVRTSYAHGSFMHHQTLNGWHSKLPSEPRSLGKNYYSLRQVPYIL